MTSIERMANIVAKLLKGMLTIVERWSTKRTLIEWYERECKKDVLVILYVVYKGESGDIWTYVEQVIIQKSREMQITSELKRVRKLIGCSIESGYVVVEDGLIKEIIKQHMTV